MPKSTTPVQLFTTETYINRTEHYSFGDSGYKPQEVAHTNAGDLYRALVAEYGRCTGKVYVDRKDGSSRHVGWVFIKRVEYDDCREMYTREVWVSVYTTDDDYCMVYAEL